MGFDWLRSCYQTKARPFSDSDTQIDIRWFFCAPGAQPFPHPHAYGSLNWHDDGPSVIGEVPGATRSYRTGVGPTTLPGDHFCGNADWFLDGAPVAAPKILPLFCCGDAVRGRFRFRGNVALFRGPVLKPLGDFRIAGPVPLNLGPILTPMGHYRFTGRVSVPSTGSTLSTHGHYRFTGRVSVPSTGSTLSMHGHYYFKGNVVLTLDDMLSGMVVPYGGASAPTGYLLCDGASYLRASYPDLFAVIGTTFGAVDGSHFNVPDMRRAVPMGAGGTAISGPANTVGAIGGEETHVLSVAELATHHHGPATLDKYVMQRTVASSGGYAAGSNQFINAANTGDAGSSTAHNNVQPSLVLNYIIRT